MDWVFLHAVLHSNFVDVIRQRVHLDGVHVLRLMLQDCLSVKLDLDIVQPLPLAP